MKKEYKLRSSLLGLFLLATVFTPIKEKENDKNDLFKDNVTYDNYLNIDKVTNKGKTYYVSPTVTKDNHGNGESRTSPEYITNVIKDGFLKPGDTVILLEGEYKLTNRIYTTFSGEYNKYISLIGENHNATISFYDMAFLDTNRGFTINGNFIYWNGVNVCGAGDNGLYIGGSYNIIEESEFYNNRDSGLQLGRGSGDYASMTQWPGYNYIKNCTSYNNYDNETYGENADGFAAKLTIGYGNIFDGCIAYRNSDDGWDLYAKTDSGNIGTVTIFNCVAFENGFLAEPQEVCNARYKTFNKNMFGEKDANGNSKEYSYNTRDGDGNGFKLGGSIMEGDTYIYNSLAFNNKMHGITDNSNPGRIYIENCTSLDNGAVVDDNKNSVTYGQIFGGSSEQEAGEECANIDVSRQTYSYNVCKNSLSLKSDYSTSIGKDAVRGSLSNSILGSKFGVNEAYKVVGDMDADTKNGITGSKINALKIDEILEKVPVVKDISGNFTYNITGKANYSIHKEYRNEDYSINMHDICKIKDYSKLLGNDNKIGCDLTKSSWEEYTHYKWTDYSEFSNITDVTLALASDSLFIPVDPNCCYQDFKLAMNLNTVSITWESSDSNIIEIGATDPMTASGVRHRNAVVYRGIEDKSCTITATLKLDGKEVKKDFTFIVKAGDPSLGEITAIGIDNGRFIYDAYTKTTLPVLSVTNGNDYSSKEIPEELYTLERKFFYATDKKSNFYQVKDFTTSVPGVYRIQNIVTLNKDGSFKIYTYEIYVAGSASNVDFVNGSNKVNVVKDGFTLSGELTSATGKLYVITSDTELSNVTKEMVLQGECKTFRNDYISFEFAHSNNAEYYIYYVITNLNNEVTSEVYSSKVQVITISTPADFNRIFSQETSSSYIYILENDLDFTGISCTAASSKKSFSGLFNGLGHTIKNVTINAKNDGASSLFYKVDGGTIENVKFENISLDCGNDNKQVGIIATCYGGNFYNIHMKNIKAHGKERVAALIGQVFEGSTTTISHIQLINDDSIVIKAESKDAAGIIGLCQTTSNPSVNYSVKIDNIRVHGSFEASTYCGGIIGRFDDQKPITYHLTVEKCVVSGTTKTSSNYCGGVIGGQVGNSSISFTNIISWVNVHHKGSLAPIVIAEKNASQIMGRNGSNASVLYCVGTMAASNTAHDIVVVSLSDIKDINKCQINLPDFINTPNEAPYYVLKYIEN